MEELIACASAARVAEAFHKLDRDKPRSNVPTQQFTLCATPLGKHMPASASHPRPSPPVALPSRTCPVFAVNKLLSKILAHASENRRVTVQ